MRHSACLTLILSYAFLPTVVHAGQEELELTATCFNNPGCLVNEMPIRLIISIKNVKSYPVACSFSTLVGKGPYMTLIDRATGKKMEIPASVPPPSSEKNYTELRPNADWTLLADLYPQELKHLRKSNVDLIAVISIATDGYLPSSRQVVSCKGETTVNLVGASD